MSGLASAQAAYDAAEPPVSEWTDAESDQIGAAITAIEELQSSLTPEQWAAVMEEVTT